ncbi:plastocyanin/azurin family copper-binding protein [Lunatibacter salilacus]|uniref:plastocyanin/azurin family copper-binding protein n=1 Tax=Lunatibacter salilacus TaxID=2483804 RepID=UPI00131E46ED|nr:plastocyanin/azurin family copper-binding protein [Lunatibacter salilacus]
MIQQGVLTLVLSACLLGVAGNTSSQKSKSIEVGVDLDAMTMCNGTTNLISEFSKSNRIPPYPTLSERVKIEQDDATTIWLEVVPELMKFDQDTITVKAGKKIILELDNLDGMQHNLLILKPNTLQKVGEAADAMLRDPKASEKHYVPDMPEVLFATEMLGPNEVYTLKFTAPTTPGNYPFVCTFPGHWRMMSGIMVVEKS